MAMQHTSLYARFANADRDFIQMLLNEVAMVHLVNLPVREAHRMERARQHLLEVIRTGRLSW